MRKANNSYVVVLLKDVDFSKFVFGEPKKVETYGHKVSVNYGDKKLYIIMDKHFMPFGVSVQLGDDKKSVSGFSVNFAMKGEKSEEEDGKFIVNDADHDRLRELDEFMMKKIVAMKAKWQLGNISRKKLYSKSALSDNKYTLSSDFSMTKDATGTLVYNHKYGPRMTAKLPTKWKTATMQVDGNNYIFEADFYATSMHDRNGKRVRLAGDMLGKYQLKNGAMVPIKGT